MSEQDRIRHTVSDFYAGAVCASTEPANPCCSPTQKGVAAQLAGYTPDELGALPEEAVVNSFGCGNPLALSEVAEGDVVLDLGSGAGIDIILAGRRVGPAGRAIGIDMTDEMIAKANDNIKATGLANVEVRKGIIEALPVESSTVDWVISNCVINLSPEKSRVFAEIARVLKPGGRMLVSDIVVEELPAEIRRNEKLYCSCVSGAISEEAYLDGLRAAGLVDAEVRERIVYDEAQLRAFIDSEVSLGDSGCCSGELVSLAGADDLAKTMTGKVWSAKFYAAKPNLIEHRRTGETK